VIYLNKFKQVNESDEDSVQKYDKIFNILIKLYSLYYGKDMIMYNIYPNNSRLIFRILKNERLVLEIDKKTGIIEIVFEYYFSVDILKFIFDHLNLNEYNLQYHYDDGELNEVSIKIFNSEIDKFVKDVQMLIDSDDLKIHLSSKKFGL